MLYDLLARPALFRMDPERAHHLVLGMLARAPAPALLRMALSTVERPVDLWGLTFRNPLGLAAGFDKDAVALPAWHALGFGFVEVGTVTRHAQEGNPRPRIFRCVRERALINRLGFPGIGAEAVAERLARYRRGHAFPRFPIGVNIGKSRVTPIEEAAGDYLYSHRVLHDHADFFVVNVSSPNTPGLRDLQGPAELRRLLGALKDQSASRPVSRPLLVKIAPDLEEREVIDLVGVARETGIDGIVATNTTVDHTGVRLEEAGGVSGAPLRRRSTEIVRLIRREHPSLPVIGVGGVFTRDDFVEKLDAGASLVEVYTGLVYEGPRMVQRILRGR